MEQNDLETALSHYHLEGASVKWIRHNENMTFQVAGKYLLRIHRHTAGFSTSLIYCEPERKAAHQNELTFLSYLKAQGMYVQRPVPNTAGTLVTILDDGTQATMLTWIPGRTLRQSDLCPDLCFQLGEMLARLHTLSLGFTAPHMLKYDAALCSRLKSGIRQLELKQIFTARETHTLTVVCDLISKNLCDTADCFLPIHADLSLSNLLTTAYGLVPIDFSLFGIGHPMLDLSALFCNLNRQENRKALAAGYCACDRTIDFPSLDCCFVLNMLLSILVNSNNSSGRKWLSTHFPCWYRETFHPFSTGNPIFSRQFHKIIYT